MNSRTIQEFGLTLGDVALLLSSISGLIGDPMEATERWNCFGFSRHKHLSREQSLLVFCDLLHFFQGREITLGRPHAEALRLLAQDNLQAWAEDPAFKSFHRWDMKQLVHMCGKLRWPGTYPRRWEYLTAPDFDRILMELTRWLSAGWRSQQPIVVPREPEFSEWLRELEHCSEMLFFSRRKIHSLGVQETSAGCLVAIELHHEMGRAVLEKEYSREPDLREVQKEVDAGPVSWTCSRDRMELFRSEDLRRPFIEVCDKPLKYAQDD